MVQHSPWLSWTGWPDMPTVLRRLASIPAYPGRWGKALACIVALWWSLGLWTHDASIHLSRAIGPPVHVFGEPSVALWMTTLGVLPIVALVLDLPLARIVGATMHMGTWAVLGVTAYQHDSFFSPALGEAIALFAAAANAEYRICVELFLVRRRSRQ